MARISALAGAVVLLAVAVAGGATQAHADSSALKTYTVVFKGDYAVDGTYAVESTYAVLCTYAVTGTYAVGGDYAVGCNYAVNGTYAVYAVARDYAVYAVTIAGGTVVNDLLRQIGVLVVQSANPTFADVMRSYAVVDEVAEDFKWKAYPTRDEAIASGQLVLAETGQGGAQPHSDPLEGLQWGMQNIRAPQAHAVQAGWDKVEVGILDTGIDGLHLDFIGPDGRSNVNCQKGRDFVTAGPGVGVPVQCVDNNFHGTHVAGIVAARANGHGVVGVAPNVELIPVNVCDATGHCYSSSSVAAITYSGDMQFEVINMSYYVDDDQLMESHEFKCMSDPVQRAFRKANERAIQYARKQGVTPVAALGNSDNDLSDPPEPYTNECEVVPAETTGVIGTMALGPSNEKARYSNYGNGAVDVAAPGGNGTTGNPLQTVLSTIPGNTWGSFQGTSMASPHAAGVAALIISQHGRLGSDGDVKLPPQTVESLLQRTAVDQGLPGYDKCFGHGRIDALRAVMGDTSKAYDGSAPYCPEYDE